MNADLKTNKLSICCCSLATRAREMKGSPCYLLPNTLRSPFGQGVPGVEAVMAYVLNEVLLYCCLAAFVTGIVLAAASLIS